MIDGRITKLDVESRTIVVSVENGEDITVSIPEDLIIEISEPETMGMMGGSFEDLEEGFHIELDVHTHQDGSCTCAELICVS